MKKTVFLGLLIGTLIYLILHSHYDYECMNHNTRGALLTVHGVICWERLANYEEFIPLKKLEARAEAERAYHQCVLDNPGNEFVCDPRYIPPQIPGESG